MMGRRLRRQDGFTVVLAIVVLLIGLLVTTALIGQSVATGGSVNRDGASKRAVQAALAGAQLGESTLMSSAATTWNDGTCPSAAGAPALTRDASGWCVPSSGASLELGANESVRYAISPQFSAGTQTAHDVVAIGTAGGISRRVRQRVTAYDVRNIFSNYAIVSDLDLTLSSNVSIGSTQINANIRSNGSITLKSNVTVCGDATPGVLPATVTEQSNVTVCGSTANPDGPIQLPTVDPTSVRAVNDDANLCAGGCPGGVPFDSTTKALSIQGSSVTVQGNTFLVCSLTMSSNSTLTFTPTDTSKPVRLFIEDPSRCSGNPAKSIDMSSNTQIATTSTQYPLVQIFVVGSNPVSIASNGSIPIELYAPLAAVTFSSNVDSIGGVVGKNVSFSSNIDLVPATDPADLDFDTTPPQPTAGAFSECPSAATFPDDPGSGC